MVTLGIIAGAQASRGLDELEVVRTKFVAPLGNAMRLVDGEQRHPRLLDHFAKSFVWESFRRHLEELEQPLAGLPHHVAVILGR